MRTAEDCLAAVPDGVRAAIESAGAEAVYLVGGFVRDCLLGRQSHDLDLAVAGDALAVARALAQRPRGALVALDPERGIYRVVLRQPEGELSVIDVSRLRAAEITGDLRARDFTINAMAVPIGNVSPSLLDPTGGLHDLRRRVVRVAGAGSFADDPLRLVRTVRFAVQLGFEIDEATATLARSQASLLRASASERQRDELAVILNSDAAAKGVRSLHDLGLLFILLPELEQSVGVEQPKEHYYTVFDHCIETLAALDAMLAEHPPVALRAAMLNGLLWNGVGWLPSVRRRLGEVAGENRPRRVALKLAGLLHDVSKPETKTVDPETGRTRFFGHAELGAGRAEAMARRLRFSTREAEYANLLVREHLRPGMLAAPGEVPTNRALFRFARDLGDAAPELLLLNLADHAAVRGPLLTREEWGRHVAFVSWVLHMLYVETGVARPLRLVTGDDVMRELDLRPGPAVGRLLNAVREAQAAGEVTNPAEAIACARAALAAGPAADEGV